MPTTYEMMTRHSLVEAVFEEHRAAIGPLWSGMRAHAYRMLNYGRSLVPEEPVEKFAVVAAFHDLPVLLDGNLRYLERAADLADEYLDGQGLREWREQVRAMIVNHHKVRAYDGLWAPSVEAMRKADWADVTAGLWYCGVDRDFVRTVRKAFPAPTLWPRGMCRLILPYAARHPRHPLPMMRW